MSGWIRIAGFQIKIIAVAKEKEMEGKAQISESEADVTGYVKRYFVHRFRR